VWGYIIASKDKDGFVELNPILIAAAIGQCTEDQVQDCINRLCEPDPKSRSKAEDGRRLVKEAEYLYRVVNAKAYDEIVKASDKKTYMRKYMKDKRANQDSNSCKPSVNPMLEDPSISMSMSSLGKEEECEKEKGDSESQVETVFNAWNRHARRKVTKNGDKISWHEHRKVSEEIVRGVEWATRHHTVDEIVAAIDNYAKVLLGSEYYWSYAWTLPDFLTRKQGKEKTSLPQIVRFLPDNFREDQWRIRRSGDGDEGSCDLAVPFLLTEEQLNRAAYEECERKGYPWTQEEADAAKAARDRGEKWVRTGPMPRYEDGQTDDDL
jgi:hypothetical protein